MKRKIYILFLSFCIAGCATKNSRDAFGDLHQTIKDNLEADYICGPVITNVFFEINSRDYNSSFPITVIKSEFVAPRE